LNIREATRAYEKWLHGQIPLIREDLRVKHHNMREGVFPFLRATYYRWAQVWPTVCNSLIDAPEVLAVGDLHVENYGTWRDAEGRLIWGINDFDEAARLPYTNDLVRLAASACLSTLRLSDERIAAAVLEGYAAGLRSHGRPFILDEVSPELRDMAVARLKRPLKYWKKLSASPTVPKSHVPKDAWRALRDDLPEDAVFERIVHRLAGLGSLGRRRYTLICKWHGGHIAREAKELTVSAAVWAGVRTPERVLYPKMLRRAFRCPDPFARPEKGWIVRRLAPDTSRIELADLPKKRYELDLLTAMGAEVANVHLGFADAAGLEKDLRKRRPDWLLRAAQAMVKSVQRDWRDFRRA
jgi:uncharacterized protein DUF2252